MSSYQPFSKKINTAELLKKRLLAESQTATKEHSGSLVHYLHGKLDEEMARILSYQDFFERTRTQPGTQQLYVTPSATISLLTGSSEDILRSYEEDLIQLGRQLDRLGVSHSLSSYYDVLYSQELQRINTQLTQSHRVGLRSDVEYYDILTGELIPRYRITRLASSLQSLHLRLFLQSNNDTIPAILLKPYELFACEAILINPYDKRYKRARGKDVILPITNKIIPVIPYEGTSIEGYGTQLLMPTHHAEDFKIALELGLSCDHYAYDKFGLFTSYAGQDFQGKSIVDFSENVVKFLDDISNIESLEEISYHEYIDSYTGRIVYPLLEKNMYLSIGQFARNDKNLVDPQSSARGDLESFNTILAKEENYCLSNHNILSASLRDFGGYFESLQQNKGNLFQSIVRCFVDFGLISLPANGDEIVACLLLKFQGEFLRKRLIQRYLPLSNFAHTKPIVEIMERVSQSQAKDSDIDQLLEYIDLGEDFVYTKRGYIYSTDHGFKYDNDYLALVHLLSHAQHSDRISITFTHTQSTFFKYFFYLYLFSFGRAICADLNIIELEHSEKDSWNLMARDLDDSKRIYFLQGISHGENIDQPSNFSLEEIHQFLTKWRNLCRIIPRNVQYHSLESLKQDIVSNFSELSDYDVFILSTLHDLYDEVKFFLGKQEVAQAAILIMQTLWYRIADILVYIVHMRPSKFSQLVAEYTICFANHLLYPLAPTIVHGLFDNLALQRSPSFFEESPLFVLERNVKCNFLLQFITQRYQETKKDDHISGFLLRANKDFIDYAKRILPDFQDFFGDQYSVEFIDEYDQWPEHIPFQKVFAMQWGVLRHKQDDSQNIPQVGESLSILKKQLLYKEQLLQTIRNTLIRARSLSQTDKISLYQQQIETLENEILVLQYQISKIRYF